MDIVARTLFQISAINVAIRAAYNLKLSIIESKNFFIINNFKLYAALIATLVALIWNNVLATISIGMASFLIMSNI